MINKKDLINNIEPLFSTQIDSEQEELDDELFDDLTDEELKEQIPLFSNEKLADIIVMYRYLSFYKELSILCMEELAKRRDNGDNFQYEGYIENNLKDLPKITFSVPDFSEMLQSFKNLGVK